MFDDVCGMSSELLRSVHDTQKRGNHKKYTSYFEANTSEEDINAFLITIHS